MGLVDDLVPKLVKVLSFLVTPDHIKLLQRAMISWDDRENQGACVDPLQPYGSTCLICDVAKILEMKPKLDLKTGTTEYSEEQKEYVMKMHTETQMALQIFLKTGKMEAGYYEHDGWYNWRRKW